jgi:amidase
MVGKTNVPELGLVPYTEPEAFGACRNPWDTTRITSGSSGGSAAAVAARMVPIATGGDAGGSIRGPASTCGLFGFKPTRGSTPCGPDVGEYWRGFNVDHVLTLSVRDSAAMLDATYGADVGAPYLAPPQKRPFLQEVTAKTGRLRIAFSTKPFLGKLVHPDVEKATMR